MIRVLIAEDSPTQLELLTSILIAAGDEVVAQAADGHQAVDLTARHSPDVVLMDINMPGMGGLEATKQIMIGHPTPIVVVSSIETESEVDISVKALQAGALTVLRKPPHPSAPGFEEAAREIVETLRAMAGMKLVRHRPLPGAGHVGALVPRERESLPRALAIAASTGGPAALSRVLRDLPADFPIPIAVVQHITPGFIHGLASMLGTVCALPVAVATNGTRFAPGRVYLAPDDCHLTVDANFRIRLGRASAADAFRPSASVLFDSVADTYGTGTLALVLTGMGQDGLEGARKVRDMGGRIIVQNQATSTVFGMPRAVMEAGLADHVVPLSGIASLLKRLSMPQVEKRRWQR